MRESMRRGADDPETAAKGTKAAVRAKEIACMILHVHSLACDDLQSAANLGLQRMKRRSAVQSLIELARTQMFSR